MQHVPKKKEIQIVYIEIYVYDHMYLIFILEKYMYVGITVTKTFILITRRHIIVSIFIETWNFY